MHTRLVNVFVNVSDASDASIGTLNKEDFQIFEDKKPQTIAVFEKQSETPLSVVMAIDTSGSMIKDARLVREAARQFVKDVIRPQDEMEVLQFAQDVSEIVPFTSDAKRIDEGLGQLTEGTSTQSLRCDLSRRAEPGCAQACWRRHAQAHHRDHLRTAVTADRALATSRRWSRRCAARR